MIAIRQIIKPENNRITIDLPVDFFSEEVEIIIMPVENNSLKSRSARKFGSGKDQTTIPDSFYDAIDEYMKV